MKSVKEGQMGRYSFISEATSAEISKYLEETYKSEPVMSHVCAKGEIFVYHIDGGTVALRGYTKKGTELFFATNADRSAIYRTKKAIEKISEKYPLVQTRQISGRLLNELLSTPYEG